MSTDVFPLNFATECADVTESLLKQPSGCHCLHYVLQTTYSAFIPFILCG